MKYKAFALVNGAILGSSGLFFGMVGCFRGMLTTVAIAGITSFKLNHQPD